MSDKTTLNLSLNFSIKTTHVLFINLFVYTVYVNLFESYLIRSLDLITLLFSKNELAMSTVPFTKYSETSCLKDFHLKSCKELCINSNIICF